MKKPAIHGHDFETSGHVKDFIDGQHETCRFCGWPFDEHPNHPSRKPNRHIVAVELDDRRRAIWG